MQLRNTPWHSYCPGGKFEIFCNALDFTTEQAFNFYIKGPTLIKLYTIFLQNDACYIQKCPRIEGRGGVRSTNLGNIFRLHSTCDCFPNRPMLIDPFATL